MIRRGLALLSVLLLAACASDQGQYPSLAIRPAERETGTFKPAPMEPVLTPPTPATLDRVSQLAADARAAHQAFVAMVASTRPVIVAARGKPVGDDAWAAGEAALADVRAARGKTMVPLADLDRMFDDAATTGQATDRIGAARDEVAGYLTAEDRTVDELSANLP
jgi:Meckel syndrome type 1 protein